MLAARQRLLVGRARDGAVGAAIAPIGTVVLLPDPDLRRRVFRCVSHVGLSCVARWGGRMNRAITDNAQRPGAYANVRLSPQATAALRRTKWRNRYGCRAPLVAISVAGILGLAGLGSLSSSVLPCRGSPGARPSK